MTVSPDSRALVPFAAALSGFIAVVFAVLLFEALAIRHMSTDGQLPGQWWVVRWYSVTFSFVLLSCPAAMVMAVVGTLIHYLISGRGLTSPWAYVAGTLSTIGGFYLLCRLGEPRLVLLETRTR